MLVLVKTTEVKMIKGQYVVNVSGEKNRRMFINNIYSQYGLLLKDSIKNMSRNKFPFVVDFNKKELWVCESITCLACAQQNGLILTEKEFNDKIWKKT